MQKITKKEARNLTNRAIEKINNLIKDEQAEPDYYPGSENSYYFMADGFRMAVEDFDLLTNADKDALRKKIQTAYMSHSEIKLLGQK